MQRPGSARGRPARVPAGALHSLQRLAATCDLVVVTSRQHCIRQPTLEWIERHFPGVFAEVHFGNHWALEGQSKAKSEICRRAARACKVCGTARERRSPARRRSQGHRSLCAHRRQPAVCSGVRGGWHGRAAVRLATVLSLEQNS
jgi:hypothetical protein